jgi:hypothetical protein
MILMGPLISPRTFHRYVRALDTESGTIALRSTYWVAWDGLFKFFEMKSNRTFAHAMDWRTCPSNASGCSFGMSCRQSTSATLMLLN